MTSACVPGHPRSEIFGMEWLLLKGVILSGVTTTTPPIAKSVLVRVVASAAADCAQDDTAVKEFSSAAKAVPFQRWDIASLKPL